MRPRRVFVLLAVVALAILLLTWQDDNNQGIPRLLRREPTAVPSACSDFDFEHLLQRGLSLLDVQPVDLDEDGIDECVIFYYRLSERLILGGHPVYGLVYHLHVDGPPGPEPNRVSLTDVHRYELRTDHGRRVQLGLATTDSVNVTPVAMDADTDGALDLVFLSRNSRGRLVGVSIFRWHGERLGYQLVGYAYGDWLETRPDPVENYLDEVVVCDFDHPADANTPNRATGYVFTWQHGQLVFDPYHSKVTCIE